MDNFYGSVTETTKLETGKKAPPKAAIWRTKKVCRAEDHTVRKAELTGRGGLLPVRHPTGDFFVCDIFDAVPKDDLATMEHPVFSLATRPDQRILNYGFVGIKVPKPPREFRYRSDLQ